MNNKEVQCNSCHRVKFSMNYRNCYLQAGRYILCLWKSFSNKPHWGLRHFLDFLPFLALFLVLRLLLWWVIHPTRSVHSLRIQLRCSNIHPVVFIFFFVFFILGRPIIFARRVRQLSIVTAAQVPYKVMIVQRGLHVFASHDAAKRNKRVVSNGRIECLTQLFINRRVVEVSFGWFTVNILKHG